MKMADKSMARQLTYMLSQLEAETTESCPSEEEEPLADDSEEDISYYADETDELKPGSESGTPMGEDLLLGEFLATTEEALQQSKTISQQLAVHVQDELIGVIHR